jgi:hypothetical protein
MQDCNEDASKETVSGREQRRLERMQVGSGQIVEPITPTKSSAVATAAHISAQSRDDLQTFCDDAENDEETPEKSSGKSTAVRALFRESRPTIHDGEVEDDDPNMQIGMAQSLEDAEEVAKKEQREMREFHEQDRIAKLEATRDLEDVLNMSDEEVTEKELRDQVIETPKEYDGKSLLNERESRRLLPKVAKKKGGRNE